MKRSSDGILTTHIGSLPRPRDLWAMIDAKDRGQRYDQGVLAQRLKSAVADIVKKYAEVGIDIPSDGEQSKSSFTNYVKDRLSGLEGINQEPYAGPPPAFPEYAEWQRSRGPNLGALLGNPPTQYRAPGMEEQG
jgi:5-methyltetrahydropteroyltriglutamate--homocysteine methyltransferase